ncbi:hypothetical protein PTTG_25575 [Puccinia triticina 1-1 BBBD Race 1]|uniref:Uncharacterized protein n=1 Tax=Puccinia triticina (isolate 1-1 / race 1 (BBBD)) TaxID=630390 RepID=A0A180H1Q9_PUCT1|nr:hypothetical protein PTTG_25575 [Puccinia triticina 1-1 BBBD Race 1]WAR59917.1 hypothetical protein PtB15_11B558 [Puccinia triticina]
MFSIVGSRLFSRRHPDFKEMFKEIKDVEFMKMSELVEFTSKWIKSKIGGELDKAATMELFESELDKISMEEFFELNPGLPTHQRNSFKSYVSKRYKKKTGKSPGWLLDLDQVKGLYEEWKNRPKRHNILAWFQKVKSLLSGLWKKMKGSISRGAK